jgi:hypothetical protein
MKTILILLIALGSSARASGLCEGLQRRYAAPTLYSAKEHAFAVKVTQDWCEVTEHMEELGGTIELVELIGATGFHDVLASVRGKDEARLADRGITFTFVAAAKLDGELKRRGYRPIVGAIKSAKHETCSVAIAWGKTDVVDDWPSQQMTVVAKVGSTRMAHADLGFAVEDRKAEAIARASWVADEKSVDIFVMVPTCNGPPPGYMGDPVGSCYRVDSVHVERLATPACF